MKREEFERQLQQLVPRLDGKTTEAWYRYGLYCLRHSGGSRRGYRNRRNPLGRKNPQQHTGYADTGWAKPLYCPEPGQG